MVKKFNIVSLCLAILLFSCEDVVDVETETGETKLVVNAVIQVDINEEFVPVRVVVSETSNFFDQNRPTSLYDNAVIMYGRRDPLNPTNFESLAFSSLAEVTPGSGIYEPDPSFDADQRIRTSALDTDTEFILIMEHKERRSFDSTSFRTPVPFDEVIQGNETLFDDDDTEIEITLSDPETTENFYVFDFGFGEFLTLEDRFINGQQFSFSYFYDRTVQPGEELNISILGATEDFYNYMDLVIEQTEDNGGVFETPIALIRGNVFDVTGLDNINIFDNVERPEDFALGYFAIVQSFQETLTVQDL